MLWLLYALVCAACCAIYFLAGVYLDGRLTVGACCCYVVLALIPALNVAFVVTWCSP